MLLTYLLTCCDADCIPASPCSI